MSRLWQPSLTRRPHTPVPAASLFRQSSSPQPTIVVLVVVGVPHCYCRPCNAAHRVGVRCALPPQPPFASSDDQPNGQSTQCAVNAMFAAPHVSLCGTQVPCLSRSPVWPALNEKETGPGTVRLGDPADRCARHAICLATGRAGASSFGRFSLLTSSVAPNIGRLQYRPPLVNLSLLQGGERGRRLLIGWHLILSEVREALLQTWC